MESESIQSSSICLMYNVYFFARFDQGHCYLGTKCTFAHGREECDYWIEFYQRLVHLENNQLLTQSFSEKVRQRMQREGPHVVSTISFLVRL